MYFIYFGHYFDVSSTSAQQALRCSWRMDMRKSQLGAMGINVCLRSPVLDCVTLRWLTNDRKCTQHVGDGPRRKVPLCWWEEEEKKRKRNFILFQKSAVAVLCLLYELDLDANFRSYYYAFASLQLRFAVTVNNSNVFVLQKIYNLIFYMSAVVVSCLFVHICRWRCCVIYTISQRGQMTCWAVASHPQYLWPPQVKQVITSLWAGQVAYALETGIWADQNTGEDPSKEAGHDRCGSFPVQILTQFARSLAPCATSRCNGSPGRSEKGRRRPLTFFHNHLQVTPPDPVTGEHQITSLCMSRWFMHKHDRCGEVMLMMLKIYYILY